MSLTERDTDTEHDTDAEQGTESEHDAEAEQNEQAELEQTPGTRRKRLRSAATRVACFVRDRKRWPALVLVAAIVLAGFGTWFTVESHTLRSSDAAANEALVNAEVTAEVTASVTSSLNRVFSYSAEDLDATEQAAESELHGDALETYTALLGQAHELAPEQEIELTSRVVNSAVTSLSGDRAELLVFLDQSATRAEDEDNSAAAAQLSITAERHDGSWLITEIDVPS